MAGGRKGNPYPSPSAYEYLRQNNNDLVALADILGHESLNTTRHYTRRRKEDLQAGEERVRYGKD